VAPISLNSNSLLHSFDRQVYHQLGKENALAIPDYQSIMLPLLRFSGDAEQHSLRETTNALAAEFGLSEEEKKELLPSGQQAVFSNRVGWARTYLKKAGLLEAPKRGFLKITDRGIEVLESNVSEINNAFLMRFEEFSKFKNYKKVEDSNPYVEEVDDQTPEERMETAFQKVKDDLAIDLLDKIKDNSPEFFEKLVVDVLVGMGYGGTRRDAGQAIGRSGDEGIDGIIKEDRLGLDIIYLQAKRWEGKVGRPEIQKFAGALQGKRAKKGVFITTSAFSNEALEFAKTIDTRIILIDGETLVQLMADFNVGVSVVNSFEVKRIDQDYFSEE
jgi:restriction system protein